MKVYKVIINEKDIKNRPYPSPNTNIFPNLDLLENNECNDSIERHAID
jgi:hypothetical protein